MKTIGLIGGMSWESTVTYYQVLNQTVKQSLGGLHSAQCLLYSVDFSEIEHYQSTGQWDECGRVLGEAAHKLECAGADAIVLCTNTMHKVTDAITQRIQVPFLHIAEMTANVLLQQGIKAVALLGTIYTMEQDFYKKILIDKGIEVLIPQEEQRKEINRIIYEELCLGEIKESSKQYYLNVIDQLCTQGEKSENSAQGAQGVILGCTEIGLLVKQADTQHRLFDTTLIHVQEAARFALK